MTSVGVPTSIGMAGRAVWALTRAGVLAPIRPDRLVRMAGALRLGVSAATAVAVGAGRHPERTALVDEDGAVSYGELDRRGAAIATGLRERFDVGADRPLALMCRNHRGFVEGLLAGSRLGADILLLNTDFPGPQLGQVLEREEPGAAVIDEEFVPAVRASEFDGPCVIAYGGRDGDGEPSLEALGDTDAEPPSSPPRRGKIILLTSGTTGTPKGAPRSPGLRAMAGPMTALLTEIPLRAREPMFVAPPFFHGLGLAFLVLGFSLGSTVVARRRFDPEATLAAIDEHGVTSLMAVPVMLQRIMELPEDVRRRYDASSLRAVLSGGAQLPGAVSNAFMDAFGDILYNGYGATETGIATLAGPDDLRAAPGTVGRPSYGVTVKILDDDRNEVPQGETGAVFMGGDLLFEGYTGGGSKEVVGELMNLGDLGHFDDAGRLMIDGRDDDMIVSGGENVFPQEVADLLVRHDRVADAAVIGVDDEQFGQRLRAFVVRQPGDEVSEDELKGHVKENLARYKVPREVIFVDEVPRSPTGKVRPADLEELAGRSG